MEYAAARALLERLGEFLDQFAKCFGRDKQRRGASRYVRGLLNDSERKSIEALHGRLSDAGSYQGLQHFITHSPWQATPKLLRWSWRRVLRCTTRRCRLQRLPPEFGGGTPIKEPPTRTTRLAHLLR